MLIIEILNLSNCFSYIPTQECSHYYEEIQRKPYGGVHSRDLFESTHERTLMDLNTRVRYKT